MDASKPEGAPPLRSRGSFEMMVNPVWIDALAQTGCTYMCESDTGGEEQVRGDASASGGEEEPSRIARTPLTTGANKGVQGERAKKNPRTFQRRQWSQGDPGVVIAWNARAPRKGSEKCLT